jgi:hypothetical protein
MFMFKAPWKDSNLLVLLPLPPSGVHLGEVLLGLHLRPVPVAAADIPRWPLRRRPPPSSTSSTCRPSSPADTADTGFASKEPK